MELPGIDSDENFIFPIITVYIDRICSTFKIQQIKIGLFQHILFVIYKHILFTIRCPLSQQCPTMGNECLDGRKEDKRKDYHHSPPRYETVRKECDPQRAAWARIDAVRNKQKNQNRKERQGDSLRINKHADVVCLFE